MPDTLTKLQYQVEDEGFAKGTPQFDFRFLEVKIDHCRTARSVNDCSDCLAYLDCEMVREYRRKKLGR